MQPPDEWAHTAQGQYDERRFGEALESFLQAIDKLHTMYACVSPEDWRREPSSDDEGILDGFVSSIGASLASGQKTDVKHQVEKATAQLAHMSRVIESGGRSAELYREGARCIVAAAHQR